MPTKKTSVKTNKKGVTVSKSNSNGTRSKTKSRMAKDYGYPKNVSKTTTVTKKKKASDKFTGVKTTTPKSKTTTYKLPYLTHSKTETKGAYTQRSTTKGYSGKAIAKDVKKRLRSNK